MLASHFLIQSVMPESPLQERVLVTLLCRELGSAMFAVAVTRDSSDKAVLDAFKNAYLLKVWPDS